MTNTEENDKLVGDFRKEKDGFEIKTIKSKMPDVLGENEVLIGTFTEEKVAFDIRIPAPILPKMLFLDDRTKRIESARRQYEGKYDLTIVTNAKECLRYLCKQQWNILSLDHDLGGDDFQDPDDVTSGMEVVRYIVKTGWPRRYTIPEIWIHSSNLFAANLMINLLQGRDIKAYSRLFVYGDEKNPWDATPNHKPEPIVDEWKERFIREKCLCCGFFKAVNNVGQCHECYKRELIQCG
jgi:hypothetical protein